MKVFFFFFGLWFGLKDCWQFTYHYCNFIFIFLKSRSSAAELGFTLKLGVMSPIPFVRPSMSGSAGSLGLVRLISLNVIMVTQVASEIFRVDYFMLNL